MNAFPVRMAQSAWRKHGALVLGGALVSASISACMRGAATPTSSSTAIADASPLHQAVHDLTSVIVYDIFSPPQASRIYAYSSVAAYEVLRQADTSYKSLAGQLTSSLGSWLISSASAGNRPC